MGQQIIKQPNGLYAVWSSIVDSFVLVDATPEELIEEWLSDERERISKFITRKIKEIENGEPAYRQFTMTYEQALATHKRVHGTDFDPKL